MSETKEQIRMSVDGSITMVYDPETETFRVPGQDDMDRLPVGDDLTQDEIDSLEG